MTKSSLSLTRLFHALADPTRLAVVERLSVGPAATGELARPFKMALPSFLQHLDVLQKCGLVRSGRKMPVSSHRVHPGSGVSSGDPTNTFHTAQNPPVPAPIPAGSRQRAGGRAGRHRP